ncbi:hypothetical protein SAMN05444413_10534 [Roseivivax marinus]|nr:hypothetical protein SAMN05444413_10534 [Roseivivax marinus]
MWSMDGRFRAPVPFTKARRWTGDRQKGPRMQTYLTRRRLLGWLTALPLAGASSACASGLSGEITFAGGTEIPEGTIRVFVEPVGDADVDPAETTLPSDGKSTALAFSLPEAGPNPRQIIAELTRADGRLIARGAAIPEEPLSVELFAVIY